MKTLAEMLRTTARLNADRTAIVEGKTAIPYSALEKKIGSFASGFYHMGVRQGDRIALLLPNGLGFVNSYFAGVTLGGIVVPLNDHYQQNELLYFLRECNVSLLATSHEFAPLCHAVMPLYPSPCRLFFVEEEPCQTGTPNLPHFNVDINPNDPVMYQFSSGSTGRPKRIARTHSHLLFELDSLVQTLGITNEDRFLGAAPFSHVNGLMRSMMASLRAGASLYPLARFERYAVAEVIEKHKISVFIGVPFMFNMLAKINFQKQPDFSSLRLCVSASAPMPKKFNQQFYEKFGIYVRQLYGSTETGTISANLNSDIEGSLDSVGTPIVGVEVEVFTEDGRIANVDEVGELAVRSPAAIKSYDGLDQLNQEAFRKGYFFTGDLGKKDREGLLYLVGRKKLFINKGGYKIDPYEIERLLETYPKVEEAVVVGIPTPYGDEKVKAVIVPNASCKEEELIEHCRGKIANFKIPSLIEFRESLPKSPTGKILRKMLTESE